MSARAPYASDPVQSRGRLFQEPASPTRSEFERDGAVVLIDSVSLPYMEGSEIDFVDDLIGQSFKIHNPNATASCGCGTSFSI